MILLFQLHRAHEVVEEEAEETAMRTLHRTVHIEVAAEVEVEEAEDADEATATISKQVEDHRGAALVLV
jgi:hypothetical protein